MACADRRRLALAMALAGAALAALAQQPRALDPAASLMAPGPAANSAPQRWTAAQVQQSFLRADSNADGQLTRSEAQQLAILPRSFEDLDANKDGVLTLAEYQAGVQ